MSWLSVKHNQQLSVFGDEEIVVLGILSEFSKGKKIVAVGNHIEEMYISREDAKLDLDHLVFLADSVRPDLNNALWDLQDDVNQCIEEEFLKRREKVRVIFSCHLEPHVKKIRVRFIGNSLEHDPAYTLAVVAEALKIDLLKL